jgi:Fur family ferric uptake transcriptional regulator
MAKKQPPAPAASEHSSLEQLYERLRSHQLKLTPPRKLILAALFNQHGPFSAEDLFSRFTKKNCDLATVYRTLSSLEEAKIIRRCEFGDGVARYELSDPDHAHHHHLICNQCKKIEVIDLSTIEDSIDRAAKKTGFKHVSHILEFFGICPDCQT